MPGAPSPPQPPDQYSAAIDSCRSVLKWVLSSFGAIAAILVAGLQLTSVGLLHDGRLIASVVAFSVAFGAVFVIIMLAIRVLAPIGGSYSEFESGAAFGPLRESLQKDPAPLRAKATSAQGLADEYQKALKEESDSYAAAAQDPSDGDRARDYAIATANRKALYPTLMGVTSFGIYLRVRQLFDQTILAIKILVPIIAVAALVFAYTTSPAKPTEPVGASAPARFTGEIPVAASAARLAQLQRRLPGGCDLPRIGYVITTTESSQTLLLATPRGCPSLILTIPGK